MAKMTVSNPIGMPDDDYPIPRCVDGVDVKKCASYEGAMRHFGKIRKQHDDWVGSKSGKRVPPPDYARDIDYDGR